MSRPSFEDYIKSLMASPEYQDQMLRYDYVVEGMAAYRERIVTVKTLKFENHLEALSLLVQSWPPVDVRYTGSYKESLDREFEATSTEDNNELSLTGFNSELFLKDLVSGLELHEGRRSLRDRSVVFDIMIPTNLDELDAYNEKVVSHNSAWADPDKGDMLNYDFDPVTGRETRLKDTLVDLAQTESTHYKSFKFNKSSGELASEAPVLRRASYGKIEYRIAVEGDIFVLGFVVTDAQDLILYYDEARGEDLAALVRQSVQEIWGNFMMKGLSGSPYRGFSQLMKGQKMRVCKDRKHPIPSWYTNRKAKVSTKNGDMGSECGFLVPVLRVFVPLLIFIFGVLVPPLSILFSDGTDSFLLTKIISSCFLIWFAIHLSNKLERRHMKLRMIDQIL